MLGTNQVSVTAYRRGYGPRRAPLRKVPHRQGLMEDGAWEKSRTAESDPEKTVILLADPANAAKVSAIHRRLGRGGHHR